jgi:hypothetical protein
LEICERINCHKRKRSPFLISTTGGVLRAVGSELHAMQLMVCNTAGTLIKLRTLISEHIIGCRKTKLSMERKLFPACGPRKYICISVVFRHLRNFSEVFRRLPDISRGFSEISGGFPQKKNKRVRAVVTMVGIELTTFGLLI